MTAPTQTPTLPRSLAARLTAERARPNRIRTAPAAGWLAVGCVCFGAFMGQLDASIVTLTFSPIEHAFDIRAAAVQWISLSYLLTLVVLLVPIGRLSDAHGRKLFYLYGFGVFTAASAACALAPSLDALVAFRVLQAVGAAMLQANSVALVTSAAPESRKRAALGVQAAAQALGLALGPVVGGLLVADFGWRSVFWVNVPIGVTAVVAGHFLLPRTRAFSPIAAFDWAGLALLAVAGVTLLLGLSAASGLPLPALATVALLLAAVAAGRGFVQRQRRAAHPLIELRVLTAPGAGRGLVGALCGYLVLFGPLVAVPAILGAKGYSQAGIGTVLTALPLGFAVAALADKVVPSSWGDSRRGMAGAGLAVVALLALLVAPMTSPWLAILLFALGVGLGLYTPANNAAVMAAIPARCAGTGGSLLSMARGLGTALGVALVTLALHLGDRTHAQHGSRAAFAVLVVAALALLGTVDRGGSGVSGSRPNSGDSVVRVARSLPSAADRTAPRPSPARTAP